MLDDCTYDKVKLLHLFSRACWFIEKHALNDAQKSGDTNCHDIFKKIHQDLERHIAILKKEL